MCYKRPHDRYSGLSLNLEANRCDRYPCHCPQAKVVGIPAVLGQLLLLVAAVHARAAGPCAAASAVPASAHEASHVSQTLRLPHPPLRKWSMLQAPAAGTAVYHVVLG